MTSKQKSLNNIKTNDLGLSKEIFRTLVDESSLGIIILQNGYVKYANNASSDISGYSLNELRNWSQNEFMQKIHPEDLPIVVENLNRKLIDEETFTSHYLIRVITKSGMIKWIDLHSKMLNYKDLPSIFATFIDITEKKEAELKIKESEETHRLITENVNDLIGILNNKFEYEYLNEEIFLKILGYTSEDIIGKSALLFIHPEDQELSAKALKEGFNKGEGTAEVRFRHKNGQWVWIEAKGKVFLDKDGKRKALIVSRDITERRNSEQILKESEQRYRLITENVNDLIAILNDELKYEYINEKIHLKLRGSSNKDRIGVKALDLVHPDDLEPVKQILSKAFEIGEGIMEVRLINKEGNYDWLEVKGKTFIDVDGKKKILLISRDITARLEAAEKIRKSEKKYRDLYEVAPNAYFSINRDGIILSCNAAAEKLLGYSRDELLNMKLIELYYDSEHGVQKAKKLFQKFLNGETSQDEELQMMKKNGEPVWISLSVKPIFDKDGNVIESRSMLIDITERKVTENALKISEQKYREAYDRANFYKDLFAHDINNILQIVNSSAELITLNLRDNEESKEIESIANIIKRQVQRGSKLVNNVQTLSELEESQLSINPIDVCEQLENSIEFIRKSYSERALNIRVDQLCEDVVSNANEYLQEVFENILINAIKYNENPSVEINVNISTQNYDKKNYYKLEFIDNGIGVADERKKLIFERGKRELKGTKGMGLGLSLVKKIIESYKGRIWVEDRVKGDYVQGSKFIILLPVLK